MGETCSPIFRGRGPIATLNAPGFRYLSPPVSSPPPSPVLGTCVPDTSEGLLPGAPVTDLSVRSTSPPVVLCETRTVSCAPRSPRLKASDST